MNTATLFLEPLDVLFLRGNKLFGDPGSYGESLVPPWPSLAAGAIRSRMLADAGVDLTAFGRGEVKHRELGTPSAPGSFAVAAFQLARRQADGSVEALFQPPADLVIAENGDGNATVRCLTPVPPGEVLMSSAPFVQLPVLAEPERSKPASGYWLNESGWQEYLRGKTPTASGLVKSSELWSLDHRIGVGLEGATRRATDQRLFSMQAVAMRPGVGFVVSVTGASPPASGSVRLGGDGRAAAIQATKQSLPQADFEAIAQTRRCRLVLTTPGLFAAGWLPTGTTKTATGEYRFDLHGVAGRLVCAAVPRSEVISGWDLANWQPKPARRAAPTGSVYWLELDEGVTAEALRKLTELGLWPEPCQDASRRAEGFNRIALAT
ncbi:MAG: type III-B CRISPR module-associated protein Cmr3 [Rhodocyclaceae bacterium]